MFRAKKIALAVAMAAATMSMAQATEVEVSTPVCCTRLTPVIPKTASR